MGDVPEVQREVDAHGDEAGHRRRQEPAGEDAVERLALDGVGAPDEPHAQHGADHGLRGGDRHTDDREEVHGQPLG